MSNENIYVGRGNSSMHDDYRDFINYVFGFNGREKDFPKLLPKLYGRADDPAANSYVVTEDGKLKAAIGAYDHTLQVCGRGLKCRSIGNVSAHPYAKSRGYMRRLMTLAVDDMVKDGVMMSTLGGRRQRYNYFSYEKSGTTYRFSVNSDNMRHTFGAERSHRFEVRRLAADDAASLDAIAALIERSAYCPVRPRERLFDILRSWEMVPVVMYEGDRFAGYAVLRGDRVSEMAMVEGDRREITDGIICLYDWKRSGTLTFDLPAFATEYIDVLYTLAENYALEINESYSVLNFAAVTDAFLALKATYTDLTDGTLTLLIHGQAGDECITLSVKGGRTAVRPATDAEAAKPEMELSHLEAINLLFSTFCPARVKLPACAQLWLPLPIWMYAADEV